MSSKPLPMPSQTLDKQQFCRLCGRFATGITVATVLDASGAPHGMTVNSFTSVSLDPLLVLICIDRRAALLEHFRRHGRFGINILAENQKHLSQTFARKSADRFESVEWMPGKTGVPLLPGVVAALECGLAQVVPAGDHDILIGEVLHGRLREDVKPLLFFASEYRALL